MSTTTKPSHPFTKDSADIILRAADGIEYRVHKLVLSEASSVFADMLTLPQPGSTVTPGSPASGHTDTETAPALPVVDLTEPSTTIEPLLRLCYPLADPTVELDAIRPIVHAARKYDMQWAVPRLGKLLTQHAVLSDPQNALRAFAIASDLDLPQAEAAARASLREPLGADMPYALNDILPASLYRLLGYRARVRAAVVQYLMDPDRWRFADDMELTRNDWRADCDDRYEGQLLRLEAGLCRATHEHCDYAEEYKAYGDDGTCRHVRLDDAGLVQELVGETEGLQGAFALGVPEGVMDEVFAMVGGCGECRAEGVRHLREFFGGLRGL